MRACPYARAPAAVNLSRFIGAQDAIWPAPLVEIQAGRKETHWMWFVFPQLRALGISPTAQYYGIADLDEARAYAADPVCGGRLREISGALLAHNNLTAHAIFGSVDAKKLRSCMTLFRAADGGDVFQKVLEKFSDNTPCRKTLSLLEDNPG